MSVCCAFRLHLLGEKVQKRVKGEDLIRNADVAISPRDFLIAIGMDLLGFFLGKKLSGCPVLVHGYVLVAPSGLDDLWHQQYTFD